MHLKPQLSYLVFLFDVLTFTVAYILYLDETNNFSLIKKKKNMFQQYGKINQNPPSRLFLSQNSTQLKPEAYRKYVKATR